jgi:hypothetical protein
MNILMVYFMVPVVDKDPSEKGFLAFIRQISLRSDDGVMGAVNQSR